MESKMKHLEFIQATITRMNQNSFQIKGWMITIVSALLALYANSENVVYVLVAIVPAIIFWFLDAYYLQQERKFRGVYNDVAGLTSEDSRVEIRDFEMPIQKYQCGKYCYFNVLLSKTIFPLYGIVIGGLFIASIMLG
ncbi:hypothetical protein D7V86_06160 [bacterium D16-51]|nr:hypothetical protein D7V96_06515 [bacterium D16-59]RKI61358.1 hypothetical protein D7V86_06160 [bacterium D16-51]